MLLAFARVQIGLIGHDAGHLAVFRDRRANWALGQVCWSLVNGIGFWFWLERHNSHHGHTNCIDGDPEFAGAGIIAFTEEDAAARRGVNRLVARYQVVFVPLFILFMLLLTLNLRIESWIYTFRHLRGLRRLDALLLVCNALVSFAPVVSLGWRWVGVFIGSELICGLYLSMIVAPNHKGMPVWARDAQLSFLEQQVLSSRNITSHMVWDFLYGGLNYQIEHHLFPTMPRPNFRQARAIIRPFCAEHGLPYEEVNPLRSYWLVLAELHRVSRAARPQPDRMPQG
jgi:fatty acid desaturase